MPSELVAELIGGQLYTSPRPASAHAFATSTLHSDLGPAFQRGRGGPGGWWILFEPELHLGPDVLVPDMAGWRQDRMPTVPKVAHFDLRPDWVCETLSPSTAGRDRVVKLEVYRREGVPHLWFVDPRPRTLEVFRLDGESYRLAGSFIGNAVVRAEPFEAIELDLSALWLEDVDEG